jgi:hypothetical protein
MLRVSEHKQRSFFDAGYLVSDEREFAFARVTRLVEGCAPA